MVKKVGVNDKKRKKEKQVRAPRDTQVIPSSMKESDDKTNDEQETGGKGTAQDHYANMIGVKNGA